MVASNEDIEQIKTLIEKKAEELGYDLTDNYPKIARAKANFFGLERWSKCPCDPDSDRACISQHCKDDIEADGQCHCHCYKRKE